MSTINDLIHTNARNAYDQGYREGTRDIFDEVLAALSDLYDRNENHSQYQEAICQAQARVEVLQERYAAQLGSE